MWSLSAVDWGPWGGAVRIARRLRFVQGGATIPKIQLCMGFFILRAIGGFSDGEKTYL